MRLSIAIWLGVSALVSQAQPPERELPQRAVALLESAELRDRAWGAYLCGSLLVKECSPKLVERLEEATSLVAAAADGPEFFYVQSLLDSLIRLDHELQAELVMRFDPRWRDEVIILLARSRDSEGPLLQLEKQELTSAEWIAVNNLLLSRHSRAFFVRLLQQTKIEHFFVVYDIEIEFGRPGGIGDGYPTDVLRKVPDDFPPIGIYRLGSEGDKGTLLAWGPCFKYGAATYSRIEILDAGTRVKPRDRTRAYRSTQCVNAYLAEFSGMSREEAEPILRPTTRIRWTNTAAYLQQVNAAMEEHVRLLRPFINGPGINDLVDLTTFRVTIHPQVSDRRKSLNVPLPKIPPREVKLY